MVCSLVSCTKSNKSPSSFQLKESPDSFIVELQAEDYVLSEHNDVIRFYEISQGYIKAVKGGWIELKGLFPYSGNYCVIIFARSTDSASISCRLEEIKPRMNDEPGKLTEDLRINDTLSGMHFGRAVSSYFPIDSGMHLMRLYYDKPVEIDRICFKAEGQIR
jgi:hypothetical protein